MAWQGSSTFIFPLFGALLYWFCAPSFREMYPPLAIAQYDANWFRVYTGVSKRQPAPNGRNNNSIYQRRVDNIILFYIIGRMPTYRNGKRTDVWLTIRKHTRAAPLSYCVGWPPPPPPPPPLPPNRGRPRGWPCKKSILRDRGRSLRARTEWSDCFVRNKRSVGGRQPAAKRTTSTFMMSKTNLSKISVFNLKNKPNLQ